MGDCQAQKKPLFHCLQEMGLGKTVQVRSCAFSQQLLNALPQLHLPASPSSCRPETITPFHSVALRSQRPFQVPAHQALLSHPAPYVSSLKRCMLSGCCQQLACTNALFTTSSLADPSAHLLPSQVMALLAYLMEHKNNYGPHIIIVPNAVIVNWKSELNTWLPDSRCVYYVGNKEERHRKYVQEVAPLQFNVLVTTYEFVMRDRTKLSKVGALTVSGHCSWSQACNMWRACPHKSL